MIENREERHQTDLKRWADVHSITIAGKLKTIQDFVEFMTFFPEYRTDCPVIGDNVVIRAGAKVFGGIKCREEL